MQKILEFQKENLFLWVPFIMAAGAALYFGLGFETHIPFATIISVILFITMCLWRAPIILRAIVIFIFGFCYAYAYTDVIDTPILKHNLRDITIQGHIEHIDYTESKSRVYIRVPANDLHLGSNQSAVVRVSLNSENLPDINDEITTTATLFVPSNPDAPGAFNFARWAYFNGITAIGYIDDWTLTNSAHIGTANSVRNWLHTHSNSMLVDGLVLGYKNKLPVSDRTIWTSAGVGHIWSISGFHMTLIMGWLFAIFYLLFRSIPAIVRRVPAKHVAMIFAWFGLILYVIVSGIGVATLRAFLMATLLCGAALLGRNAFSLRNICIVFCLLFLINPYYIMTAGFQLSFSAIFGIAWFWYTVNPKMPTNKILKTFYTAILTTIIASLFTAPFIAAHFYSVPLYSIIGNLILLPIFSVLIMPLVMIGTITAVLGILFPLHIADIIYNWSLSIAKAIAHLPFATLNIPYISNTALCLIIFGLICIVLVKPMRIKINYILGATFILIAIIIISVPNKPLFFITSDHELVAFLDKGKIIFNKSRASNHFFTFDTWKRFANIPIDTPNARAKHDGGLYLFQSPKITIAYMQKFTAMRNNLEELCKDDNVDFIVSYMDIHAPSCEHKILRGGFIMLESGKIIYPYHARRWNNLR